MAAYEEKTGGRVLAIPHNGNLSNGLMFDDVTLTGRSPSIRTTPSAARRWEPIYEVTQIKGDGEAHPMLSPDDDFADYETWDRGTSAPCQGKGHDPARVCPRSAQAGPPVSAGLGANPFKFGMVGSTDTHTSLSDRRRNEFLRQGDDGRALSRSGAARRKDHRRTAGPGRPRLRDPALQERSPPASPRSGPRETPARNSGTR